VPELFQLSFALSTRLGYGVFYFAPTNFQYSPVAPHLKCQIFLESAALIVHARLSGIEQTTKFLKSEIEIGGYYVGVEIPAQLPPTFLH